MLVNSLHSNYCFTTKILIDYELSNVGSVRAKQNSKGKTKMFKDNYLLIKNLYRLYARN